MPISHECGSGLCKLVCDMQAHTVAMTVVGERIVQLSYIDASLYPSPLREHLEFDHGSRLESCKNVEELAGS